jgi:hypothetical protein
MSRDIIDVYDRSIFEMRNVFTAEECQAFIDYHKNSPDKKAGTVMSSQGTETVNKKCKISTDTAIEDPTHDLFTRFVEGVKKARLEYTTHVSNTNRCCGLSYLNVGYITNPQIQRTDKGGKFEWHSDFSSGERQLAIIVYLNDIDEENGGSTEFNSGRKVQPEVGKVIVFPVTHLHLHKGNTILNGPSKYIITTFIKDPNDPTDEGKKDDKPNNFPFIYH